MNEKSARCVTLLCAIAAIALLAAGGCTTGKKQTRSADDDKVLYSPPADADKPIQVPRGAPILEEYARPATPAATAAQPDFPTDALSDGEPGEVTRELVEAVLAQGPGWGLAQVSVSPVQQGDALVGFRIDGFSEIAAALSPPLATGDIITHLNGVRIKTPDDYMVAWSQSARVDELRVDFLRDGRANYSSWRVVD